jgi:hypothetical protein
LNHARFKLNQLVACRAGSQCRQAGCDVAWFGAIALIVYVGVVRYIDDCGNSIGLLLVDPSVIITLSQWSDCGNSGATTV